MPNNELEELTRRLKDTPDEMTRLSSGLSEDELRWKPADNAFSVLENVCHLRDIEAEAYSPRIERLLCEDDPVLADVDGGRLALERDYNRQELEDALERFIMARADNLRLLREATQEQFSRSGTFEGQGRIDLAKLVAMMVEHDKAHIAEMTELRRVLRESRANFSLPNLAYEAVGKLRETLIKYSTRSDG